jgi:hypothetical protein
LKCACHWNRNAADSAADSGVASRVISTSLTAATSPFARAVRRTEVHPIRPFSLGYPSVKFDPPASAELALPHVLSLRLAESGPSPSERVTDLSKSRDSDRSGLLIDRFAWVCYYSNFTNSNDRFVDVRPSHPTMHPGIFGLSSMGRRGRREWALVPLFFRSLRRRQSRIPAGNERSAAVNFL